MRAFYIDEPGVGRVGEAPEPEPRPDEVLLAIKIVGLCGSDLNTWRGRNALVEFPRIPGHEIGATIAAVGRDVPGHLTVGRSVTVSPYTGCGACSACRAGRPNCCRANQTLGVQRDGALCERLAVPWSKILVADGLSLPELALVEPITIGFHAVARGQVTAADTVAVLGCGTIGLGVIAGAAARGARVIGIDLDDAKLELGRACGATETINSGTEPLLERLADLTGGDGPEVVVEAIGLPATYRAAVEAVAWAGRVVYIGYAPTEVAYETKLFVLKELDLRGSRNALPADFEAVIAFLQARRFPVQRVLTRTVPLADTAAALTDWSADPARVTKIQVAVA